MRLRPIAPVLFLEPTDDTVIADVQVPRGTPVFALSMYHARRDSHFVHGGSFDPDRWLRDGAVPRSQGHDTRAFLPFGAGVGGLKWREGRKGENEGEGGAGQMGGW